MTYATYEFFTELYGESLSADIFNRLSWEASRFMDDHTTGVDGFVKLREAFPTDEYMVEAVRRCCCRLVKEMYAAEERQANSTGYVQREDGTVSPKLVTSISSGSESVSFANHGSSVISQNTTTSTDEQARIYGQIIRQSLCRVFDANGVNVLYMGRYPVHV